MPASVIALFNNIIHAELLLSLHALPQGIGIQPEGEQSSAKQLCKRSVVDSLMSSIRFLFTESTR